MSDLRVVRELRAELLAAEPARRRRATRRTLIVAIALVVLGVGIATAATGSFPIGEPIPSPWGDEDSQRNPHAPRQGSGRLQAIRTPDPAGGPPWGVRDFRTRDRLVCPQVGRVVDERLGVIGDDGVFHELPLAATGCSGPPRPPRPDDSVLFSSHGGSSQGIPANGAEPREYARDACTDHVGPRSSIDPRTVVCDDRPRRWIEHGTTGPRVVAIELRAPGLRERHPVVDGHYLIVRDSPLPRGIRGFAVFRDGRRERVITFSFGGRVKRHVRRDPRFARQARLSSAPALAGPDGLVTVSLRVPHVDPPRYGSWYDVELAGPPGCARQGRLRFTVQASRRLRPGDALRFGIRPPGPTVRERAEWCRGRYAGSVVMQSRLDLGRFGFEVR